jgi:NAD kinase
MNTLEKIVVVTRETALDELIAKYNTKEQARFYLETLGHNFAAIEAAHQQYRYSLQFLLKAIPKNVRTQLLGREMLPTYSFSERDLVVVLGPDGLVVNTAKYVGEQPVLAFNPDPSQIDGVLLPFDIGKAGYYLKHALKGALPAKKVSMAQVQTSDGQRLLAVNDLFLGQKTHVAARYSIRWRDKIQPQISSGVIVSTGAGSSGWRKSIFQGSFAIAERDRDEADYRRSLDCKKLGFAVREPFESRISKIDIVVGELEPGEKLELVSQMSEGVIFSDGLANDFLNWGEGIKAEVSLARETLSLLGA